MIVPVLLLGAAAGRVAAQGSLADADDPSKPIRFLRQPSLSPEGGRIAFSYQGDLWTVPVDGGTASRLTLHEAHDQLPSWSPDGKWLAFSSKREGNYDVWLMAANGGRPRQLTFHSAEDLVSGWTPDGREILFSSARETTRYSSIYAVSVATGASRLVASDDLALANASMAPNGEWIACTRGGSWPRKHYRGSGNSNLIAFSAKQSAPGTWLVKEPENERWPVVSADGKALYYVSDKSGEANLWRRELDGTKPGSKVTQLTRFTDDNIFYPSYSKATDRVIFEHGFGLWTLGLNGGKASEPTEIKIFAPTDDRTNPVRKEAFTTDAQEVAFSPNGRQLAITVHGELWTQPATGGEMTRVTETPQREEDVAWSPDSGKLVFSSDRTGNSDIYLTDLKTRQTKALTETPGVAESVPRFSPDGKWIAFLRGWAGQELCLIPAEGGEPKVLVHDPNIMSIAWSPDSRWIAYDRRKSHSAGSLSDIFLVKADGSAKAANITRYPMFNTQPVWSQDGKTLFFLSDRSEIGNIWALPLQDPANQPETDGPAAAPAEAKPTEVKIDLDGIHLRARQVTRAETDIRGFSVSPDGRSVYYPMTQVGRMDLWRSSVGPAAVPAARLTQAGEPVLGMEMAPDGSRLLYVTTGGGLRSLSLAAAPAGATIAATPWPFSARMDVDTRAELTQLFDEGWRKMRDAFYDENMHGADWNKVRSTYRPVVQYITDKTDFYVLFSLVLGELNASHTGLTPARDLSAGTSTASLGFMLDDTHTGPGVKIKTVMPKGPADREGSRLKPGEYVLKVDGQPFATNEQYFRLLGDKFGRRIELLVNSEPKEEGARTVRVRSITSVAYKALEYDRWTKAGEKTVAELSQGKLGYLHLQAMDDTNLERFRRAAFGDLQENDGLVLDLRFNGGGSIADEILNILQDKIWSVRTLRGDATKSTAPLKAFNKPVIVLINESSFSNAEAFPWGFKTLKLGKVVGVPTYGGCIGTGGTTLLDGSPLRIPGVGAYTLDGINMENNGCPPDFYVENNPEDVYQGQDRQLRKAVEELLKDTRKK